MDAGPILRRVAAALNAVKLEAVMVGNAAAALQGAPVTTLDVDFMFRKTAGNLRKLKALADRLGATVLRPYYPLSDLFRVVDDTGGLQLDFMASLHGVPSFEGLRKRATRLDLPEGVLLVAALEDVIRSKRAAGRPHDRAVLETLESTLAQKKSRAKR